MGHRLTATLNKFAIIIIEIGKEKETSRKETSSPSKVNFSVLKITDKRNRHDTIYSEISDELSDFKNDIVQRTIQQTSGNDLGLETTCKRPDRRQHKHTGGGRDRKN